MSRIRAKIGVVLGSAAVALAAGFRRRPRRIGERSRLPRRRHPLELLHEHRRLRYGESAPLKPDWHGLRGYRLITATPPRQARVPQPSSTRAAADTLT
jgi:hypothetical protein